MTLYILFCRHEGQMIYKEAESEPTVCPTCGSSDIVMKANIPTDGIIQMGDYPVKADPVDGDVLIIEDSEASGVKKYILIGSLPSGGSVEHVTVVDGYHHLIAANQSGYYGINNADGVITGVEDYAKIQMPACSVKAIRGRCTTLGEDMAFTIRKNGADTGLTGSVTALGKFSITGGGPIAFADGDEMSLAFSIGPGQATAISGLEIVDDREVS